MANKEILARDFDVKSNQTFFFDNNIWMFLFCPIANYEQKKQDSVSRLLDSILRMGSSIAINSLIVSEFANSYLRLDFALWKKETQNYTANFKGDYFHTEKAIETRNTIMTIVKNRILKIADKYPDNFNSLDFNYISKLFTNLDYNDSLILDACNKNDWILVSDDKDFTTIGNEITVIRP